MCMSVTSYYLVCGHAHYQQAACSKAACYLANISSEYCNQSRSSTSLVDGSCEECAFLRGLENLRFNDADDPLIWMNQIYRASVHEEPEPYDQAVNDSVNLVVDADMRSKTILKRFARNCWGAAFDQRKHDRKKGVACQTPSDIFYNEKTPRVGGGTPPRRRASHGRFGTKTVDGVTRGVVIEEE
jgi:hypothetical protein